MSTFLPSPRVDMPFTCHRKHQNLIIKELVRTGRFWCVNTKRRERTWHAHLLCVDMRCECLHYRCNECLSHVVLARSQAFTLNLRHSGIVVRGFEVRVLTTSWLHSQCTRRPASQLWCGGSPANDGDWVFCRRSSFMHARIAHRGPRTTSEPAHGSDTASDMMACRQ